MVKEAHDDITAERYVSQKISYKSNYKLSWLFLHDKAKAEKADDVKARLILEKLEEDDAKTKAQQEMVVCIEKQEDSQKEFTRSTNALQVQLSLSHLKNCWEETGWLYKGLIVVFLLVFFPTGWNPEAW